MKNWSLRKKLIWWYSLFFMLLILTNLLVVFFASDMIIAQNAEENIQEVTEDIARSIDIVGGVVYYDFEDNERFIYFEDGIAFVLYLNDAFYEGQYPANLPEEFPIQPYETQTYESPTGTWFIYDLPLQDNYTLRAFYNYQGGFEVYGDFIRVLAIVAPILLTVSALGGLWIIQKTLKPVRAMAGTAKTIQSSENYSLRLNVPHTHDEIDTLAKTLNQMLTKVEESLQRERDFSANVSHELRTPLAVIQAQTEYLESKLSDPAFQKDFQTINHQLAHMQSLIEQMLELARMNDQTTLDLETVDISGLISSILEDFQANASQKNIDLKPMGLEHSIFLNTHVTFFIRIVSNMIDNAIKFTPDKGVVTLEIRETPSHLTIDVTDTGIGIKPEDQEKIFQALYQVEAARTQSQTGIGLGLALTKQMIQQLGGSITVSSQLKGGTTFTVQLPKH